MKHWKLFESSGIMAVTEEAALLPFKEKAKLVVQLRKRSKTCARMIPVFSESGERLASCGPSKVLRLLAAGKARVSIAEAPNSEVIAR